MSKIKVMAVGLPGKMATEIAHVPEDFELLPVSLTAQHIQLNEVEVGSQKVRLIKPDTREEAIEELKRAYGKFIPVDFVADSSQPDLTNKQADFYCRHGLSFVMGSTGGDRKALEERVKNSDVCAVIAPNMAKQIVALQNAISEYAKAHPGCLAGCKLHVRESHQGPDPEYGFAGKADTSGTAKAIVNDFRSMGIQFKDEDITKIRMRVDQQMIGVDNEFLDAHGWHTYWVYDLKNQNLALVDFYDYLSNVLRNHPAFADYKTKDFGTRLAKRSQDNTVHIDLKMEDSNHSLFIVHNINGRAVYRDGAFDAVRFLDKKAADGRHGEVYSMAPVMFNK